MSEIVEQALAEVAARKHALSFSGRNPDLGPMIKCHVCGTRHRRNERKCEQKIVMPTGQTRKGVLGAAVFAKKRIHPHPNQRTAWKRRPPELTKEEDVREDSSGN
jgi:hypothetical protein